MLECRSLMYSLADGGVSRRLFDLPNLSYSRGELILCHGPSGSGKTSFLEVCAGMVRPTKGDVIWDNKVIHSPEDYRGAMCFMTAAPALFNELSVHDNMVLPMVLKQADLRQVENDMNDLTAQLSLGEVSLSKSPALCSSGEKMRLALMRSLLQRPDVLFLDEPTANCDSRLAEQIFSFLHGYVTSRDVLVVMASHDPVAQTYAHKTCDMSLATS